MVQVRPGVFVVVAIFLVIVANPTRARGHHRQRTPPSRTTTTPDPPLSRSRFSGKIGCMDRSGRGGALFVHTAILSAGRDRVGGLRSAILPGQQRQSSTHGGLRKNFWTFFTDNPTLCGITSENASIRKFFGEPPHVGSAARRAGSTHGGGIQKIASSKGGGIAGRDPHPPKWPQHNI